MFWPPFYTLENQRDTCLFYSGKHSCKCHTKTGGSAGKKMLLSLVIGEEQGTASLSILQASPQTVKQHPWQRTINTSCITIRKHVSWGSYFILRVFFCSRWTTNIDSGVPAEASSHKKETNELVPYTSTSARSITVITAHFH